MVDIHRAPIRRIGQHKEKRSFKKIAVAIFLIVFLGGVLWATHTKSFLIQSVYLSGTKTIDPSTLKTITEDALDGSYVWLFPKRNVFLYPKKNILKLLLSSEPRIESVTVKANLQNLTQLEVVITERDSNLVWCALANECSLLDEDGVIYTMVPIDTDMERLFVIVKEDEKLQPIGTKVVEPKILAPLFTIKNALDKDVALTKGILLPDGDYALVSIEGTKIFFNKNDNLEIVIDNIFTLFRSDIIKGDGTGTILEWLSGIEYIDTRFGKKIFYKERPQ